MVHRIVKTDDGSWNLNILDDYGKLLLTLRTNGEDGANELADALEAYCLDFPETYP